MSADEKYKEIMILATMLTKKAIPYTMMRKHGGWQIGYPLLDSRDTVMTISEHDMSCGHETDDLEVVLKGGTLHEYVSASHALGMIEDHYKRIKE